MPGVVSGNTAKGKTLKSSGGGPTSHQAIIIKQGCTVLLGRRGGGADTLGPGRLFGGADV